MRGGRPAAGTPAGDGCRRADGQSPRPTSARLDARRDIQRRSMVVENPGWCLLSQLDGPVMSRGTLAGGGAYATSCGSVSP
jgi:hypothetical protein